MSDKNAKLELKLKRAVVNSTPSRAIFLFAKELADR
jgi:hypothetical protein